MSTERDRAAKDRDAPLVDPELAALLRSHADAEPPTALDDAILAAAHRAVSAGPQPTDDRLAEAREPQRWWWPLAAAAAIGAVAIGLLQLQSPTIPPSDQTVSDLPRGEASSSRPAPVPGPGPGTQDRAVPASKTMPFEADRPAPAAPSVSHIGESGEPAKRPDTKTEAANAIGAGGAAARPQTRLDETERRQGSVVPGRPESQPPSDMRVPAAPAPPREAPASERRDADRPAAPSPPPPLPSIPPASPRPLGEASTPSTSERVTTAPVPPPSLPQASTPGTAAQPAAKLAAPRAFPGAGGPASSPADAQAGSIAQRERGSVQRNDLRTPEDWIAALRRLRRDGPEHEARSLLQAFRATYADADARLPEDLRAWAASVPR